MSDFHGIPPLLPEPPPHVTGIFAAGRRAALRALAQRKQARSANLKGYHRLGGWFPREARDPASVRWQAAVLAKHDLREPKVVVIDPRISYGRPVLAGTGIPTAVVAERYKAGESIDELAEDYGRSRKEIEETIRCELWLEAA